MEEVMINKGAKLSQYFTLGEMMKTKVKGISNVPTHAAALRRATIGESA